MPEDFRFFNDSNNNNMFNLSILKKNVKIILEVMKSLSLMSINKLAAASEIISLIDIIRQNNAYVELLIRNAMVLAISDRGLSPPAIFKQSESKIFYALSK